MLIRWRYVQWLVTIFIGMLPYQAAGNDLSGFHSAMAIKEMHVPIRTVEKGKAIELQMGTEHGIEMYQHWTGTRKG